VANTDVTILTLCSTLINVSIYSVYYTVVYGINTIIMTFVTGLESLWGNMLAKREMNKLKQTFEIVEWGMHAGCTLVFTITGILIAPFVQVYTKGISDANYVQPIFGALLVAAYGVQCLRVPYFRIIKAAGDYRQTQNGSIVQMMINILVSIALVYRYGLNGVAAGTLIAMFYHTCYFAWYLRKNIINREIKHFILYILVDAICVVACAFVCRWIGIQANTYFDWIIAAIKVTICSTATCGFIHWVFYHKRIMKYLNQLKK